LSADDILGAAIFFGVIIVREAFPQMNGPPVATNQVRDCSWPAVLPTRKLSHGRTTILKTGRDDSVKAFAAR
jgi:hypothetical protein